MKELKQNINVILENTRKEIIKLDRNQENGFNLQVKVGYSEDIYNNLTLEQILEKIKDELNYLSISEILDLAKEHRNSPSNYLKDFEIFVFTDVDDSLNNNFSLSLTEEESVEIFKEKEDVVKYFELAEEIGLDGIKKIEKEMFEENDNKMFSEYFYFGDDENKQIISTFNNLSAGGSLNEVYNFMVEKMIAYVKGDILG